MDPTALEAAQALVQAELARSSAAAAAAAPPALDVSTLPTLGAHFARLSTDGSNGDDDRPRLDATRFTLPAPSAGLDASEDEWRAALDNAYVQLAHQEGRAINIDLMKQYGANHWRISNYTLDAALGRLSAARAHLTDTVSASTNRTRRLLQHDADAKLAALEASWSTLVSTQLQLGVATLAAQADVARLREQRERLQARLAQLEAATS